VGQAWGIDDRANRVERRRSLNRCANRSDERSHFAQNVRFLGEKHMVASPREIDDSRIGHCALQDGDPSVKMRRGDTREGLEIGTFLGTLRLIAAGTQLVIDRLRNEPADGEDRSSNPRIVSLLPAYSIALSTSLVEPL
jgi:hypothetical protein